MVKWFMRGRNRSKGGGALILEERKDELILKPAAVMEIEIYDDEQVAQWNKEDQLTELERTQIRKSLERQN